MHLAKTVPIVRCFFIMASLLFALTGNLLAQQHVYVFNRLSAEQGLTSGQFNYYVHQDREGLVWISSVMGLNRFDGRHVKNYHSDPNDPNSLRHEFASQSRFQEASNGDLWFTNNVCLTHYDRRKDHFYHYQFVKPDGAKAKTRYFWAYLDKKTGTLFTSGDKHLFALNINNPDQHFYVDTVYVYLKDRMVPASGGGYLLFMCGSGDSTLHVRHYKDYCLDGSPMSYPAPEGVGINDVHYESDTLTWVATTKGLYRFDLLSQKWQKASASYEGKAIVNTVEIARRKNGQLIIATNNQGVFFYSPSQNKYTGEIKSFQDDRVLPFNLAVERMTLDDKENLWIYVKDDGLYYTCLNKPKFKMGLAGLGNGIKSFKAVAEGKNGVIWGLLTKKVVKMSPADTTYFPLPISGIDLEQTTSILEDRQGRVWVGTLKELFVLQPGKSNFSKINLLPQGTSNKPPGYNHFMELSNGDLLIATNALQLLWVNVSLRESRWFTTSFNRPRNLFKGNNDHFLVYTYQDSLFAGHLNDNKEFLIDTVFTAIPFVSEIRAASERDVYWVGTFNGLFRLTYAQKKWNLKKESNINPNLIINSLLLADDGQLWMAIPGGLMRYNPETHQQNLYKKPDGLQGPDYNINAALKHSDGRFFFGGTNGLTVFRPGEIFSTVPLARPAIVAIKINQEEGVAQLYSPDGEVNPMYMQNLRLPYTKNNISLSIAPLEFSDPSSCRFKYQLLGSTDASVVDIGNNPQIDFLNLSPGRYTLNIWASNSDGVWSEQPRRLKIEILPPWYQTGWFFMLLILVIAGVFYGLYRYRLRELMQRQSLEKAASEAKQLAAETETAVLRLQMNPHFIFNSLNSIDAYILGGDKLKAHDYLIRFADLMRGILNSSEKAMNSIDDEIELLAKYLDTEQMRIGSRLSYSFVVAPEVDTYETEIPTMILQPFVENAIWHGISPKAGPGHIRISFHIASGELVCEVTDDGVGRKASSGSVKKHESKALTITHRRLALLGNEAASHKPTCTIHDEVDDAGLPAGTRVRVCFPMD